MTPPQTLKYPRDRSVICTFVPGKYHLFLTAKQSKAKQNQISAVTSSLSPMALRISLSSSPSLHPTPSGRNYSPTSSLVPTRCVDWSSNKRRVASAISKEIRRESIVTVRCSLEATQEAEAAAAAVAVEGQVTEVSKDTFWPIVNAAGDKVVVLDMYTQWCGPCKIIAPKYQELSEKYLDVVFLKLDCNQDNKSLAKELGIRVVPTFKILKEGKVIKEVTGAKFDDLKFAIDTAKSS